ncbi:unnamed protein product [Malus baccata var. baccata]
MWGHLPKPLQHIKTLRHSTKCPWISFFSYSYSDAPHKRSKLAPPQTGFGFMLKGVVVAVVAPALAAVDMISVADLMIAQRGGHGSSKNEIGTRGADKLIFSTRQNCLEICWYEGTTEVGSTDVYSHSFTSPKSCSENETEKKDHIQHNVAELTVQVQRVIIACGGEWGMGNVSSVKVFDDEESSLRVGLPVSEAVLILELKSIADVSLPAVGHYAFITLSPNLGNLNFEDFSLTVADIPRLIEGAHENRGLGLAFLQYIERTKVLAYVVDLASGLDGRVGIPPWEQLRDLVFELEYHQESLSNRPSLIVANKIEEDGGEEVYEELERRVQDVSIFPVCAVLEDGKLVNGETSDRLVLAKIMVG